MSFGSRRFLSGSGRTRTATTMTFTGGGNLNCSTVSINDTDGNTVLGTGTYTSNNNLPTNLGTGGFVNAPMVVQLTPGRVYSIAIIRDHTSGNVNSHVPQVQTNVDTDEAILELRYGNLSSLNNPPEQNLNTLLYKKFDDQDLSSEEPVLLGPNDGNGNPTPPAIFKYNNAGWIDDKIILAEGFSVDTTHDDNLGLTGGGSNHTPKGLYVRFNVAQSSNGASARMKVSVTEGYFL